MKVLLTLQDVEPAVRINAVLERDGVETALVSPLDDIRAALKREKPDILVFSAELNDPSTISIVKEQLWEGAAAVGLSDNMDPAHIERLRMLGFVDIFAKPVNVDEVVGGIRRVLERRRLQALTGLIGESEGMREVMVQVEQMAPVSSTVLIEGESGTGKELVARAIRLLSNRRNKPFIAVNVGALPETLLESELFGHEKGAFTGAAERRLGRFELADTGTLFLDEIGEIPLMLQAKLLRVLEEQSFRRLGGLKDIQLDLRVVAATNKNLREAVKEGAFRQDLYFRLNVIQILIPPLRERAEDIVPLTRFFIEHYNRKFKRNIEGVTEAAADLLLSHDWPGNVRELRNAIERAMILEESARITPASLPIAISRPENGAPMAVPASIDARADGLSLEDNERILLVRALDKTAGNQTQAARLLRITRDTLRYKMKKFNLR